MTTERIFLTAIVAIISAAATGIAYCVAKILLSHGTVRSVVLAVLGTGALAALTVAAYFWSLILGGALLVRTGRFLPFLTYTIAVALFDVLYGVTILSNLVRSSRIRVVAGSVLFAVSAGVATCYVGLSLLVIPS